MIPGGRCLRIRRSRRPTSAGKSKTTLGCSLEPLTERDLQAVREIELLSNPAPWSEESFRAELSNTQATYFVAKCGDKVVGFCGYWRVIDEAHVTNVAVHPNYRKRGLGRSLMVTLLEHAASNGLTCSTLEVRAGNENAISLYEKLGYVKCAVRKSYYPNNHEDAIVMWLYDLEKRPWST